MASTVDQLIAEDVSPDSITEDVTNGSFPVGRLYLIIRRLVAENSPDRNLRISYGDCNVYSGMWGARDVSLLCYCICVSALENKECDFNDDIKDLVLGFINDDIHANGETIQDMWNTSPFENLRNADPLPDSSEDNASDPVDPVDKFYHIVSALNLYGIVFLAFMVAYCGAVVHVMSPISNNLM